MARQEPRSCQIVNKVVAGWMCVDEGMLDTEESANVECSAMVRNRLRELNGARVNEQLKQIES